MPRKAAVAKNERPQSAGQQAANLKKAGNAAPVRRVAPVVIRKETNAADKAASSGVAEMPTTGEPTIKHQTQEVEPVHQVGGQKLDDLRFMEEPVTVFIHETADKDADPRFEISVNGQTMIFVRGQEYTVKRKFVEGLARAKPMTFNNEEYFKQDGSRSVRWPSKSGLRYSFSVVKDDNPRGRAWLASVARQP